MLLSPEHRVTLGLVACGLCFLANAAWSGASDYWPTQGWRTSTPEAQGMKSDVLADMFTDLTDSDHSIDSVTIIRNGYIVLDAYFYPFRKDTKHILHSCTKSITSTLVGIAIDKGYIQNVQQQLMGFFPEIGPANMAGGKDRITLENVLTMTTGLDCRDSYRHRWQGLKRMMRSDSWTQYMLDLPMVAPPGTRFVYCNGASYLLSAIVKEATGMRTLEFARQNLFGPLGITDVRWEANPHGIDVGFGRMWLKPHDMAKFGWLFLNKGQWDGRCVVSADWVDAATRGHIETKSSDQYGYQWWVDKEGSFAAMGHRGQRIFVVPQHDLVAVFTCFDAPRTPDFVMRSHIIPSIVSDAALPADTVANQRLQALVRRLQAPPAPKPIPPHPGITRTISGRTYRFDANELGIQSFRIDFKARRDAAVLDYMQNDRLISVAIGLDDVYRLSDAPGELTAFKGRWRTDYAFYFSFFEVGHTFFSKARIEFDDAQARVRLTDPQGGIVELKGASDLNKERKVEN